MATTGDWNHLNPTFTVHAEVTNIKTGAYKVTVKSNFTGSSYYGYPFKVYVGTSFSSKTQIISFSGTHNSSNQINESYTGNYELGIATLNFWMECGDSTCNRNEYNGVDNPIISLTGLYTAPSSLAITRTGITGTTITAKETFEAGNKDISQVYFDLYDSNKEYLDEYQFSDLVSGKSHKFTGLTNGTLYYVKLGVNDSINPKESSYYEFRTYKTVIPDGITTTSTSVTIPDIRMTYASYSDITTPTSMYYEILDSSSTVVKSGTATITDGKTGSITINGLSPATTYTIKAYPSDISDASTSASFTTKDSPSDLIVSVDDVTGETVSLTPLWNGGSDETVTVTITVNGTSKSTTNKGEALKFTGLSHGKSYDFSASGSGSETGDFGSTSGRFTTYKATISANMRSAKSIIINSFGYNKGSIGSTPKNMYYELLNNAGNSIADPVSVPLDSTDIIIDGLNRKTAYKIRYWLDKPSDTREVVNITTGNLISKMSISATASSGTTITVKATWNENDELGSSATITLGEESKSVSNGGSVKFTGLVQGTEYSFKGNATGTEGGASSASCNGKTYDINISWIETKTTSQTVKFSIVTGNSGNKDSSIRFKIKKSSDSDWGSEQTGSTSDTVISGLTENTSYDIQYYITGVTDENGNLDVVKIDTFSTLSALSGLKLEATNITGTTATIKVTWNESGSTGIVATVKLNGVSKTVSTKGGTVQFTGLTNGTAYTVSGSATDNEGNKTNAPNISVTTYKVGITIEDASTRAGKYKLEIIAGSDTSLTIDYTCQQSSTTDSPLTASSGDSKIADGLWQHTTYIVTAWIDNMKDENGNLDTKVTASFTTKALTVQCTSSSYTQHTITTQWQAYANGEEYDKCQLTDNAITFNISKCNNTPKATTGYQTTDITGSVSGSYKTLESAGLCYYAYYTIECTVSDGKNESSSTVDVHTDFPYSYVNDGSGFKKVVPYIYADGKWQKAPVFVNNGAWRESNGE